MSPTDEATSGEGERYGRNFIRQADKSEIPATISYWGASRCQPMGVPGRYSLIRAMANALESMPDQWAILCAQGQQERWKRPSCCPVVRLAEERHSPPRNDTAHLEVRKRDIGDRFEEDSLLGIRDEGLAIVETQGPIAFEESSRLCHDPSVPWQWSQLTRQSSIRRTAAIRNGTADADA